jgi:hypothetical protein
VAFRIYVVPVVTTGNRREPKYLAETDPVRAGWWSGKDYGMEPWMLIGADFSAIDDAALTANADVFALPFDLRPVLTAAQVTNVQTKLEAANIPAGWVNTSLTWIHVVRTVDHIFRFLQRFLFIRAQQIGRFPDRLFLGGVTLDTTFAALPADVQAAIVDTADSLDLDRTGMTGAITIRAILKSVADQMGTVPVRFNAVLI